MVLCPSENILFEHQVSKKNSERSQYWELECHKVSDSGCWLKQPFYVLQMRLLSQPKRCVGASPNSLQYRPDRSWSTPMSNYPPCWLLYVFSYLGHIALRRRKILLEHIMNSQIFFCKWNICWVNKPPWTISISSEKHTLEKKKKTSFLTLLLTESPSRLCSFLRVALLIDGLACALIIEDTTSQPSRSNLLSTYFLLHFQFRAFSTKCFSTISEHSSLNCMWKNFA